MLHPFHSRLDSLSAKLQQHQVDYYWLPSSDEHLNEYVPAYKQRIFAISGFSGSTATLLLSSNSKSHIFVDSRYHVQADQEIDRQQFEVHKEGKQNVLSPTKWIVAQSRKEKSALQIGFDPFLMTSITYQQWVHDFQNTNVTLVPLLNGNWIDEVWSDQSSSPRKPIYSLESEKTGESYTQKIQKLRKHLQEHQISWIIFSKLDEIAWLLNLRGSDITFNPVFESYLAISAQEIICFSKTQEVPDLSAGGIVFQPYQNYVPFLQHLSLQSNLRFWLDASSTTLGTYLTLFPEILPTLQSPQILQKQNPVVLWKARKNRVELAQMQKAHHHAALGKIRSFVDLEEQCLQKIPISEKAYANLLFDHYAQEEEFTDLSFTTIAGFGANGAIVHYSNPSDQVLLEEGHLFLIDSGIQSLGGTTDDTRTICIGLPTPEQIFRYTLVLKAHIQLAQQVFPQGTTGSALDAICRGVLWNQGMDFGHGTGHGVGAFLNVHEGPHSISPRAHDVALEVGMVVSNEPGYYEANWGGIRLENLYTVVQKDHFPAHPSGKTWFGFETLTLIPFSAPLIDFTILTSEEKQWLQEYHHQIQEMILPKLNGKYHDWLAKELQPFFDA